jgi:hypothetical protein
MGGVNLGRELKRQMPVGETFDRLSQHQPIYILIAVARLAVSPLSVITLVMTTCGMSNTSD